MIMRHLTEQIDKTLEVRPAIVLLGPRQVGKTTLALEIGKTRPSVYLDLEVPSDLVKLDDPEFYFSQNNDVLIIIDEVQRRPGIFPVIRSQIDKNRRAGRRAGQFLLLGAASNLLLEQSSESLAGRVSYQELRPFSLSEIGNDNLNRLWIHGGFPDSYLEPYDSFAWRQDFIKTYLERDIPALGVRIPAETLRRCWTMLAHLQGQLFNASQIGGSLGVKGQTASRYVDLLIDLMLVRTLRPWHGNIGKRLIKSPKIYVRDSGIQHALLGIQTMDDLLGHPVLGASWEGFVIENLLAAVPSGSEAFFYRTRAGAEIDLLVSYQGALWAIEIKRNSAPSLTKGFHMACEDLSPTHKRVVYPGHETYPIKDDILVSSLSDLIEELSAF